MNEEELRRRLHAMPQPRGTIDSAAAITAARRRRTPKRIAVGAAVVTACLGIAAPVVLPGLLAGPGVQSTAEEAQESASRVPDAEPAPTAATESAPEAVPQTAVPYAAGGACVQPDPQAAGLTLAAADDPADGSAELRLTNDGAEAVRLRIGQAGLAILDADTGSVVAATDLDASSAATGELRTLDAGETLLVQLVADTSATPCGDDGAEGDPAPILLVAIDGASTPTLLIGQPWP